MQNMSLQNFTKLHSILTPLKTCLEYGELNRTDTRGWIMTYYTNYTAANKGCYSLQSSESPATEPTLPLKEKIISMIYPAIGILGITYQLYQVFSR